MEYKFQPFPLRQVSLAPGMFRQRFDLTLKFMMDLELENLLQNHYLEAGLWSAQFRSTLYGDPGDGAERHWGWESPTSPIRGQFLGHWLSAMARTYAATGDLEVKGRADKVVKEIGRCQEKNGGEWCASIPEKYLEWLAAGYTVWAPQYVVHKTLMGLWEMSQLAGNAQALEIMEKCASWFHRWSGRFTREQMDAILNTETGGMLEIWANLYGLTGKSQYLDLIQRYDRRQLFGRLLAGEDPLTNHHANTTIPEAIGAARAYEVTGDRRWLEIVEAYWRCAVTERGYFCTGGQTSGEVWTPPFEFAARLGDKTQEHCTVYNLMRLAEILLRWTGDGIYADYIERNLYNGILAQQNPESGMVCYSLPLHAGSHKIWGSPTHDFWCCHGTLVQAHTGHNALIYYQTGDGLAVTQYIPSELHWAWQGIPVEVRLSMDPEVNPLHAFHHGGPVHRPRRWVVDLSVRCDAPVQFTLQVRLPWWLAGAARVLVNGEAQEVNSQAGFIRLCRLWDTDQVHIELPMQLSVCPLPDDPLRVAIMEGPVVFAGLVDEERTLYGERERPETILAPDDEREWETWRPGFRTVNQGRNFGFIPLYRVVNETYTVYFPLKTNA